MIIKSSIILFFTFLLSASVHGQSPYRCSGPGLSELMNIDLMVLQSKEVKPAFIRNSPQFDIKAYYQDTDLKAITVSYSGESDKEDIKAYFQNENDYLMTYHKQQNSTFYFENDSVLLKEDKSYFHVCDGQLLAPAVGGVIDNDLYDNTRYMIEAILRELNGT